LITLTTYADARDAFRRRELRQALYDEGEHLMAGVIVNLHGDEHVARRRLENRLFRRDTFRWYEREHVPNIIEAVLNPARFEGHGDLLTIARHTMMMLSVDVAGIDRPRGTADELAHLYDVMDRMARAATVAHATGDKAAIIADGDAALREFCDAFYDSSAARRRNLVSQVERGDLSADDLPKDVLTTLLVNHDRLDLQPETMLREVAYYPWVGSHSTSNQLVHAMHHILEFTATHPSEHASLVDDAVHRQRFVHESIRLHPASPVARRIALADVTLPSGATIRTNEGVVIHVEQANRDRLVFGPDAERYDPFRAIAEGVAPWGLSFGHGPHACLGQELAGGSDPNDNERDHLLGTINVMAGALLHAGARLNPDDRPVLDTSTTRHMWHRFPVLFGAPNV
jgi:cytochrome P450